MIQFETKSEREFWEAVYVSVIRSTRHWTESAEVAAVSIADQALLARRERNVNVV